MSAQLKPQPATTPAVRLYRDHWKVLHAETQIMIDETKQLSITTSKNQSGMLVTRASVMHVQPDGSMACVLLQDFSESRVAQSRPGWVTEKVVLEQHNSVDMGAVTKRAKAFYNL